MYFIILAFPKLSPNGLMDIMRSGTFIVTGLLAKSSPERVCRKELQQRITWVLMWLDWARMEGREDSTTRVMDGTVCLGSAELFGSLWQLHTPIQPRRLKRTRSPECYAPSVCYLVDAALRYTIHEVGTSATYSPLFLREMFLSCPVVNVRCLIKTLLL